MPATICSSRNCRVLAGFSSSGLAGRGWLDRSRGRCWGGTGGSVLQPPAQTVTSPAPASRSISDFRECGESLGKRRGRLKGEGFIPQTPHPSPCARQIPTLQTPLILLELHIPPQQSKAPQSPQKTNFPSGPEFLLPCGLAGCEIQGKAAVGRCESPPCCRLLSASALDPSTRLELLPPEEGLQGQLPPPTSWAPSERCCQ